jgi:hypothetical protein
MRWENKTHCPMQGDVRKEDNTQEVKYTTVVLTKENCFSSWHNHAPVYGILV